MEKQDLVVICKDCGKEYIITASEQTFYESKDLALPKRCSECRAARKAANSVNKESEKTQIKEEAPKSLDDLMRDAGII